MGHRRAVLLEGPGMTPDSPVPPQQRMHVNDERLVSLILDYVRDRLSLAETPLDHPGDKAAIDGLLDGLITTGGTDPAVVMDHTRFSFDVPL